MTARTIEAKLLITGQDKGASAAINAVVKATAGLEKAGKATAQMQKLTDQLGKLEASARAVERVRQAGGAVASAEMSMRLATTRARELAGALDAAKKGAKGAEEIKGLTTQVQAAERAVKATTAALAREEQAARAARSALNALGVPIADLVKHQDALADRTRRATQAIEQQAAAEKRAAEAARRAAATREAADAQAAARSARSSVRREALGTVGSTAMLIASAKGKDLGQRAVLSVVDFDYATRKQQAFAGISKADQDRLLIPQALKIGKDTKFTNTDIVNAQTAIAQRLPKNLPLADVSAEITEQTQYYAQALGADMKTSAESITAYMLSTGKDLSTAEKARKAALRTTNILIQSAKLAGSTDDDIQAFNRFGVQAGSQAGFSDEMLGAFQAGMKRSGINGDQAGTALRTISARFLAPTQKGQAAMAAAGIDYMKHVKMPEALSVSAMERKFQQDFGKSFSASQRRRLDEVLSDPDIVGNREDFVEEVSKIQMESFGKNKKGKYNAADQNKVAKKAFEFHKFNQENVDVGALLIEILKKDPSLGVLNAVVTDKHGGKVGGLAKMVEFFLQDIEKLKNVPDDFGKKISDLVTGGIGGSFEKLKGSVETFTLSIGRANEDILKVSFDRLGDTIDKFSELPQWAQQALSIGGGGAALAGTGVAAWNLGKKLMGFGPLNASAVALTESAAALTAAAVKLGADPKDIKSLAEKAAPAGGALVAGAVVGGVVVGGAAASVVANEAVKNKEFAAPYLEGGMLGADPGGYGLGAAIMHAPEIRKQMEEANRLAPRMALDPAQAPMTLGLGGGSFAIGRGSLAYKSGQEAGTYTIEGIVKGIQAEAPKAEEQAKSLYERIKGYFSEVIKVQIQVEGGDGLSGASGSDGLKGGMGSDDLGGGTSAGTGAGHGGLRRLGRGGGGGGATVPRGQAGPGTGTGDSWYEAVMRAEGTAGKDPYNVVLGNGAYGLPDKPLTEMTLAEAYRFGRTVRARHGASSALGAFQIVGRTMKGHMRHVGLGWDDKFSPENQRKLAASIRQREGWGAWEGFKVHPGELRRARSGGWEVPEGSPARAGGAGAVVPPLPPFGGATERRMPQGDTAADRMERAADRMAALSLSTRHTVEVLAGPGVKARTKGMSATGSPGVKPNVGVSMPGAEMQNVG